MSSDVRRDLPTGESASASVEEWRPIEGHSGYEISNLGRVRSPRGILKPHVTRLGYLEICVSGKPIGTKRYAVHRLVMAAFVGPANGMEVDHLDAVKANNALTNLEYVTRTENMRRASRQGLLSHIGSTSSRSLTPEKLQELLTLDASGMAEEKIAEAIGSNQSTVSRVLLGETYWQLSGIPRRIPVRRGRVGRPPRREAAANDNAKSRVRASRKAAKQRLYRMAWREWKSLSDAKVAAILAVLDAPETVASEERP